MACSSAHRMVEAAQSWIGSLTAAQGGAAVLPWDSSDDERHRWFYTPTDHGGLALKDMSAAQQGMAMRLLSTGLSRAGYVSATTIMGLENVLDLTENWRVDWGRERGRDPQLYWLRVFGEPDLDGPWAWRFGGHHVSVQHVVLGGEIVSSSPCFLGADPAESPLLGGHLLRPLGATEDLARELMRSLDEGQAADALLSTVAPVDLVTGNRPYVGDGDTVMPLPDLWRGPLTEPRLFEQALAMHTGAEAKAGMSTSQHHAVGLSAIPKGVAAKAMTGSQRELLRAVLDTFIGRIPEDLAEREAGKFAGDLLDAVHFAWAGGVERGQPHYYRLQGPRLLAEYDNTQRDVNHIHTVWRDPSADFADDVLGRHRMDFHTGTRLI